MRHRLVPQEKVLYNLSMRLDAFLSKFAGFSRSQSRKMIKNRVVTVNGEIVNSPSAIVDEKDKIVANGMTVEAFGMIYIALNKPVDYVCSREKAEGKSVFDLVETNFSAGLSVAGRLDKDTTGLVLLSNDGKFIHEVISPRNFVEKEYMVETSNEITEEQVLALSRGVFIGKDEFSKPVFLEVLDSSHLKIVLTEGRYHEVKRLVSAAGNNVSRLHRTRIGSYVLSSVLKPGEWDYLSNADTKRITGT
ncbi:pseudouridine synthase [Mesotoga sp. BH458_6_3_2_1]|uniref:pseudouridine synthase n=1 Tax=Mesotoga sp. BH458_6_3_2_1 TaxID=1437446 RepID=UPI002878129C|nr:pseudouridine synthase [Mesotoga sp. BH458_6_3_2_1]